MGRGWPLASHGIAWCAALALLLVAARAAAQASPWFEQGRPGPQAQQAVALLAASAAHGLDPQDYAAGALQQALAQMAGGPPPGPARVAAVDVALTRAMQRYLRDLHVGRVDPRQLGQSYAPPRREPFDAAAVLQAALAEGRLAEAARDAAPRVPQYDRLRAALAALRALADHPAWREPLPPLPPAARGKAPKLELGQEWAGLPAMARRLVALGDLGALPADAAYGPAFVEGVKAFQRRHGLADDGVIGHATLNALQVGPAARARQVELALERLRWTPLLQEGPRTIVVNIPEFVLRAYEVQGGGRIALALQTRVIVGKALRTRTPLFDADLRLVEFRPYWNVPPSIARAELVPRLRRDPGHFDREGFEFVGPSGKVDATLTDAKLDALAAGRLRIRQRPGERNALGGVKFVFPNAMNIYLHHTPSVGLFAAPRRDFSHGCIRVEQPVDLAQWVLQGVPGWTRERIEQAMDDAAAPQTLRVAAPPRVLIAYGTALVKDGRLHFFDDIYGQDALLDAALRQVARERRADDRLHSI